MIIEILKEDVESQRKNGKFYKVGDRTIVEPDFGNEVIKSGRAKEVDSITPPDISELSNEENKKKIKERIEENKKLTKKG